MYTLRYYTPLVETFNRKQDDCLNVANHDTGEPRPRPPIYPTIDNEEYLCCGSTTRATTGLLSAFKNHKTRKEKKKDYDGQLLIKQYRLIDMSDEAEVYVPPTSSNMLAPSSGDDADIYVDPDQTNDATIVSQLAKQGFPKGASLC